VSPEGSLATEASGRGGAVQGRPVLVKDILQWQYLHEMMGADHQSARSVRASPQDPNATK